VAGGAVAQKLLAGFGVEIVAWVAQVHEIAAAVDLASISRAAVEAHATRCPVPEVAEEMARRIDLARRDGNSLGGVVEAVARGVPAGWGEPVFDKLDAELAKAMLSIPAAKGFEIGSGFAGVRMTGAEHNDPFYRGEGGRTRTRTNHSGGVQGGISNGEAVFVRVAFKPTATINREQETVDVDGNDTTIKARGRHDPCVLPRAVPIVEAMMALVLADHALRHRGQCG
jgi:chorismate synthase